MTTWNTVVPVIAGVRAGDEAEAVMKLTAALRKAGFETYEGAIPGPGAFADDEQMTVDIP